MTNLVKVSKHLYISDFEKDRFLYTKPSFLFVYVLCCSMHYVTMSRKEPYSHSQAPGFFVCGVGWSLGACQPCMLANTYEACPQEPMTPLYNIRVLSIYLAWKLGN